jgi:low temperature requirement protein LtrA
MELQRIRRMQIENETSAENAPGTHRADTRPIIERPYLRTKDDGARPPSWLEVFFDLVFVVAIDQVARRASIYELTWTVIVGYLLLYAMVWWAWVGYVIYNDRFGTDDLADRLFTLAQMAAVLVLAVRAHDALEAGAVGFAAAYGAFRLVLALRYGVAAIAIRQVRRHASLQGAGYGLAAVLYLGSILCSPHVRYVVWAIAFVIDLLTPFLVKGFHTEVPPDATHLEERFGTFVNIVLGIGFVGLVEGVRDLVWHDGTAISGFLALCIGFSTWWVYFETLDVAPIARIGRDEGTGPYRLWLFAQLPLAAGLATAGVAVGATVHFGGEPVLPARWRILHCGAVALSFVALALLQLAYAGSGGGRKSRVLAARMLITVAMAIAVLFLGRGRSAKFVMIGLAAATVLQVVWALHDRARLRGEARRQRTRRSRSQRSGEQRPRQPEPQSA